MATQYVAKFTKEIYKNQGKGFPKSRQMVIPKKDLLKIVDNFWKGTNGYGIGPDGESRTYVPLYTHEGDGPNVGYVTELAYIEETESLWATIGILKNDIAMELDKRVIPDNSIAFGREPDMKDMGRYLVHVALVNDPKIVDLAPFKRASNDGKIETIYCSNLSPFKEVKSMTEENVELEAEVEKDVEEEVKEITEDANMVVAETETAEELATKSILQSFIDKFGVAKLNEVLRKAQLDEDEDEEEEEEDASNNVVQVVEKSESLVKKVKKMLGLDAATNELKASVDEKDTEIDKLKASLNEANAVMELALKEKEEELVAQKDKEWDMVFNDYLEAKMSVPSERKFLAEKFTDVEELKTYLDSRGINFDFHTESILATKDRTKEDGILNEDDFAYLRGKGWIDDDGKPVNERCKKVVEKFREEKKLETEQNN